MDLYSVQIRILLFRIRTEITRILYLLLNNAYESYWITGTGVVKQLLQLLDLSANRKTWKYLAENSNNIVVPAAQSKMVRF